MREPLCGNGIVRFYPLRAVKLRCPEGLRSRLTLGVRLRRKYFRAGWREVKNNQPLARHRMTIDFRGSEVPAACRLQRQVREIFARAGRSKLGSAHIARGIHVHLYSYAHFPVNRGLCLLRRRGQDLRKNFTWRGTGRRFCNHIAGRCALNGFRAKSSRSRRCGNFGWVSGWRCTGLFIVSRWRRC